MTDQCWYWYNSTNREQHPTTEPSAVSSPETVVVVPTTTNQNEKDAPCRFETRTDTTSSVTVFDTLCLSRKNNHNHNHDTTTATIESSRGRGRSSSSNTVAFQDQQFHEGTRHGVVYPNLGVAPMSLLQLAEQDDIEFLQLQQQKKKRLNNFCKTPANHNSLVLAKHLRAFRALKQLADHNDDKGMAEDDKSTIRLARQRSSSIQTGNRPLADPNTAPCCSLQVLTSDVTATTTTATTTATTALPTKPIVVPKCNADAAGKHKMLMKLTKHFEMKRKKKSLIVQKLKQRRDTKRKVKRRLLVELEEVAAFDSIVQGNTVTPKVVAPPPLASNNHYETAQQQTRSSSSSSSFVIPPPKQTGTNQQPSKKPCRLLQEIADYNGKGITEKLFRPSRRRCRLV